MSPAAPRLATTRTELAAARDTLTGRVGVVMTMGALHAGHVRLIEAAHESADAVIVTIFVNPLQFGAGEDLDRYPRDLQADLEVCAEHSVDLVFAPPVEEVYPKGERVTPRHAGELGRRLEGAIRPGHFDGMLTVVARMLDLTRPDVAFFGEKDAQQLALIRRMAAEAGYPVEIVGVETVREPDGLALSSRNQYLDEAGRGSAVVLSRALHAGADVADEGVHAVLAAARAVLAKNPEVSIDYVAVVDERTWDDPDADTREARILIAGRVGTTRLIDNLPIVLGTRHHVG